MVFMVDALRSVPFAFLILAVLVQDCVEFLHIGLCELVVGVFHLVLFQTQILAPSDKLLGISVFANDVVVLVDVRHFFEFVHVDLDQHFQLDLLGPDDFAVYHVVLDRVQRLDPGRLDDFYFVIPGATCVVFPHPENN